MRSAYGRDIVGDCNWRCQVLLSVLRIVLIKNVRMILRIGNVFCLDDRQKVTDILEWLGLGPARMSGDEVIMAQALSDAELAGLERALAEAGMYLLKTQQDILVNGIKMHAHDYVRYPPQPLVNFSEYVEQKMGYHYNYLSNVFSAWGEAPVARYIASLKMQLAKELIRKGCPFTEIATRLNYANVSHLSFVFRKRTGQTMSAYRQTVAAQNVDG